MMATRISAGTALLAVLFGGGLPGHEAIAAGDADRGFLTARVSKSCELRVRRMDSEGNSCWFLACKARKKVNLGCGLTEMSQIAEISVSPDRHWLGIVSAGEGHPILEIVDLAQWLASHRYRALKSINPFPGTITLAGWRGGALRVSSDMPLPKLPIANEPPETYLLSPPQVFSIEPRTGRIEPAPDHAIRP